MYKEYKVLLIEEGMLGTIFLGQSRIPLERMEAAINAEAAAGWQVVFQIVEKRRMLLLWSRESVLITMGRE